MGRLGPAFDQVQDNAAVGQGAVFGQLGVVGNEDLIRPMADQDWGQVSDVVPEDKGAQGGFQLIGQPSPRSQQLQADGLQLTLDLLGEDQHPLVLHRAYDSSSK